MNKKKGGKKMFGFKKKDKNKTKTFVDGEATVQEKVPELSVPIPPPDEKTEEVVQLNAQEVYDEGRSVGFQEGMINAMNLINTELVRIQTELREQIKKDAEAKK